jgi:hypothetical protein
MTKINVMIYLAERGKIIMDWRDRKYYVASFSPEAYDMRMKILKSIEGVKLHSSTNHKINTKFPDEKELRGSYHVLIGCKADIKDIVEFELREAKRNDWWAKWKEVQRDISKKYFDIYGQEMPYRKCYLNPRKRCNHCMDC